MNKEGMIALALLLLLFSGCQPNEEGMGKRGEQLREFFEANTSTPLNNTEIAAAQEPIKPEEPLEPEAPPEELTFEEAYWNERIDAALEPVACPRPPARNLPDSTYQGTMIDTHIHIRSLPDGGPGSEWSDDNLGVGFRMADWICMMNYENTSKAFAFFPVWEPITQQSLDVVQRTLEQYPDRFVPFIMPPDDDGSPDGSPTVDSAELQAMLSLSPGLFLGYGEIGLYERPNGAPALPPDSPRLTELYPVIRQHNLIVYFHLGEGQKEAFEKVLDANPDITFIWHGDQLIQCSSCKQNLDDVEDILENHPNAYYGVDELYGDVYLIRPEVTKKEFIAHFNDYEPLLEKDLNTWQTFIENHPDQVLWGTDRGVGAPWSLDPDAAQTLNTYTRAFIGRLDPSVQEKFAYKNAQRLIIG